MSSNITRPRVLLLGASGGMGRRIAELWSVDVPDVPLRLGVRRLETLRHFAGPPGTQVVMVHRDNPASLRAALEDVEVVINAMGPFTYDPVPLLNACEAAAAHYVDLASEPEFLSATRSWAERPEVSIAVCPGASTVPGLIELAVAHLVQQIGEGPSAFDIFLSMGSANPLTPGLLSSLTLPLGEPLRSPEGGRAYRTLRAHSLPDLGRRLFGRYPAAFDEAGLPVGEQHVPARFWVGLDCPWIVRALWAVSYVRPCFSDRAWVALVARVCPLIGLVNFIGGPRGGMAVEALDGSGRVLGAVHFSAPREGLNVPALPSVWAARALLRGAASGYRPLPGLVTFDEAAASLRAHEYEMSVELPAWSRPTV